MFLGIDEKYGTLSIHLYECSTCRYVRLNTLNVLHVHGPCFNAPYLVECSVFEFGFRAPNVIISGRSSHRQNASHRRTRLASNLVDVNRRRMEMAPKVFRRNDSGHHRQRRQTSRTPKQKSRRHRRTKFNFEISLSLVKSSG